MDTYDLFTLTPEAIEHYKELGHDFSGKMLICSEWYDNDIPGWKHSHPLYDRSGGDRMYGAEGVDFCFYTNEIDEKFELMSSMSALIKREGIEIDLSYGNVASVTYLSQTVKFDYLHDATSTSDAIKGDVLNSLIADSAVDNYHDYWEWKDDTMLSQEQYAHDKLQTKQLKELLGNKWPLFLQQYNRAQ